MILLVAARRAAMRSRKPEKSGNDDLFRSRFDQIIDMRHARRCAPGSRGAHWRRNRARQRRQSLPRRDAPKLFRVYRSGERGGVHGVIKKKLRRPAVLEPVVGHLKTDGHVGRNYFKCRDGDQANAVPTATG